MLPSIFNYLSCASFDVLFLYCSSLLLKVYLLILFSNTQIIIKKFIKRNSVTIIEINYVIGGQLGQISSKTLSYEIENVGTLT